MKLPFPENLGGDAKGLLQSHSYTLVPKPMWDKIWWELGRPVGGQIEVDCKGQILWAVRMDLFR